MLNAASALTTHNTPSTSCGHLTVSSPFARTSLICLFAATAILSGCTRPPATGPTMAFRETQPLQVSDDLNLNGLLEAVETQAAVFGRAPDTVMQFGPVTKTRREYGEALKGLSSVLSSPVPTDQKLAYLKNHFRFFEYYGGESWGEILLTSYFEPTIRGSLTSTRSLTTPLYKKPTDLVTIPLRSFSERFKDEKPLKGRLHKDTLVPYYSRAEIDGRQMLRGRNLELVWVDPIDAFFLQIQGSGTVRLPDGSEIHLTYADKNGHRYEPIGKYLKSRLAPRKVTMQRIEAALRGMPMEEREQLLFKNPSYVFFHRSNRRALTSLGVPATPGRTIAVDPLFAPKGALAMLTFDKPIFSSNHLDGDDPIGTERVSRIVVDQDTGGAITGTNRVDLFWGRGDEAKKYAGVIQSSARIVYLVPR